MHLLKDRNDRALFGTGSLALVGLGIAAGLSLLPPATAADQVAAVRTEMFRAQPARGVVPHAHIITESATGDGLASIVRDPKDLPPPIGTRGPQRMKVDLETVEITGKLADGAAYRYWTFNQKVPGPFVRVRVGDTVEVRLKNHDDNAVTTSSDPVLRPHPDLGEGEVTMRDERSWGWTITREAEMRGAPWRS